MVSTNFKVSSEAKNEFVQNIESNTYRYLLLEIKNEEIVWKEGVERTDSMENDFNTIKDHIENKEKDSVFIVFQIDDGKYLLLVYQGKKSKVQARMLYSSSVGTLKTQLGNQYFVGEHTFDDSELSFENFTWESKSVRYKQRKEMMTEQELTVSKENVESSSISAPTTSGVQGVSFPINDDAKNAIVAFAESKKNVVVVRIENEEVKLDQAYDDCDIDAFVGNLPAKEPRFIFLRLSHQFEENDCVETFFLYVCPMASKVKQRMIYSSSKGHVLNFHKMELNHNIELSDPNEITLEFLVAEAHPVKVEAKIIRKKPSRKREGRRRVLLE